MPVTVIIPAWLRDVQDVSWLIEAVESVIAQTVFCRCVIVENGSSLLPNSPGSISIRHSEKGLSIARNAGVKASTTEFFFPLDANDLLEPNAIETAVKKMPTKGFLYGSTMLFRGERGAGDQHYYEAKPYDFNEILKAVYFPCGTLQRKSDWEIIGGWRENLEMLEDWDYWITAGEKGICGTPIPDLLYWYRRHGGIVETNSHTPQWEAAKQLVHQYHAESYKGVYTPMCCGRSNPPFPQRAAPVAQRVAGSVNAQTFVGKDGFVKVEYAGGNFGKTPYRGPVTNTRYYGSKLNPVILVDIRDAPGLLELMDHNQPVFKKVVE